MGYTPLRYITENPVTTAYDAREKTIQDQKDSDLRNAIGQASLLRTVKMLPYEVRQAETGANAADLKFETDKQIQPDVVSKSHYDAAGSQQDYDFKAQDNPILLRSHGAQADTNASQARVQTSTEDKQIAEAGYRAEGSRLSNLTSIGNLHDQETKRDRDSTTWNQEQIAKQNQTDEDLLLSAASDPDGAIERATAAGAKISPELVSALKSNPLARQAAADLISQLRGVSSDSAWRQAKFKQHFGQLMKVPPEDIPAATRALVEQLRQEAPGQKEVDPLWKGAMDQAGKELDQQFFGTAEDRSGAIDSRAKEIYRSLKAGPSAAPQAAAPSPAASAQPAPAVSPGLAALGGPQPLPRLQNGSLDRSKLVNGGIYNMPNVGRVKFNGQGFEAVEQ
jgi:hypothetical protein